MIKILVVGLGNIGIKYENTRHNIGFLVVDNLAKKFKANFKFEKLGLYANFNHKGKKFILLKPTTYMNLSGNAIDYWLKKEKIGLENLLVVCDNLYLPLGILRLKPKGSQGGHNGLRSIQEVLGSIYYARLRLGIGNDFSKGQQSNYVLGQWRSEEKVSLEISIEKATDAIVLFGLEGIEKTMNLYNK